MAAVTSCENTLLYFAILVDSPVVVAKLPNDSGHLLHLYILSAVTLSGT